MLIWRLLRFRWRRPPLQNLSGKGPIKHLWNLGYSQTYVCKSVLDGETPRSFLNCSIEKKCLNWSFLHPSIINFNLLSASYLNLFQSGELKGRGCSITGSPSGNPVYANYVGSLDIQLQKDLDLGFKGGTPKIFGVFCSLSNLFPLHSIRIFKIFWNFRF